MPLDFLKSNPSDSKLIESIRQGGQGREWAAGHLLRQNIFFVKKLANQFGLAEENVLDAYTDSLLSSSGADEAVSVFEGISATSSIRQDAEWYRALALLKAGKTAAAKAAFEQIAGQERHFKKREAGEVLREF